MVVLVILALAAGLVLSRGPARSAHLDLRVQASQIAQALRGARGQAIATNRRVAFVLDAGQRNFRVGSGPQRPLPQAMQVSMVAGDGQDRNTHVPAILFAPDGSASGGTIALAEGSTRMQVAVDWLTGRVHVSDAP